MSDGIIYNAIRTPDGTTISSRHRHDYVTHEDANGKTYMVDGGLDYLRRSAYDDQVELSLTIDDDHERVREVLAWGTYGKNGDEPYRQVLIKDMTSNHLQAVLKNCVGIYPQIREAMITELDLRGKL